MRGLGIDQFISGPIRGPKKIDPMAHTDTQTDRHSDSKTESAQWADSVKM